MKLLTVGDSFTFGEELSDVTDNVTPSKFAWPELLASRLDWEVDNLAKPASGNTRMIRTVVNEIDNYDVFIIAWSHWARIEFADDFGMHDIWPGSNINVHSDIPHRKELVNYITHYHSDHYLYRQYLINVVLLQSFLKQRNKQYIIVNSFGNNWGEFKHLQDIQQLASQIDITYFLGWPDDQMVEWAWGCAKGPNGHFLEQGHQRVADKIYEHIRYLGWVS